MGHGARATAPMVSDCVPKSSSRQRLRSATAPVLDLRPEMGHVSLSPYKISSYVQCSLDKMGHDLGQVIDVERTLGGGCHQYSNRKVRQGSYREGPCRQRLHLHSNTFPRRDRCCSRCQHPTESDCCLILSKRPLISIFGPSWSNISKHFNAVGS